jgi:1-acylglycerone phosphate reductase
MPDSVLPLSRMSLGGEANSDITGLEKPGIETQLDEIKTPFDINVFAPMQMINEFFPLLVAAKGTIVNHGSMVRSLPHPFTSAYNASKAALSQYSNTLRLELEPLDIKVIELVSGRIATSLITVPTLSEASIYKPLEQILQSRAREAGTSPYLLADKDIELIDGRRNPTKDRSIC